MKLELNIYTYAFLAVLLIGIFLRYYNIEYFGTFGHDNSRDLILTYKLYKYHEWLHRGPVFSIVWAHLSPIYYYLIYPFYYLLRFHPLAPAYFSSFLNVIALILIWRVTKEIFGKVPAIIAAIIYSVSFLVIKEGAFGLNPCFMPIFAILLLYGIFLKTKGNFKGSLLISISLAMLVSFHPSGFFVLPVVAAVLIFLKQKFSKKEIIYSSLIFIFLAIIPYLYQQKKFNWWDLKKLMEYASAPREASVGFFTYVSNFFKILNLNISTTFFYSDAYLFNLMSLFIIILIIFYSFLGWKRIGFLGIIAFMITVYSLVFAYVLKFKDTGLHAAWFQSILIPWIVIFISVLLSKLNNGRKQIFLIAILLLIITQNLYSYFTYASQEDKFYSQKLIAEKIRQDSNGRDFDIYGEDTQPFFYMLWYYEPEDSEYKDKYYSWLKWSKTKDSNLVYFLDTKYQINDDFKKVFTEQHGVNDIERIFMYNERNLYRIQ